MHLATVALARHLDGLLTYVATHCAKGDLLLGLHSQRVITQQQHMQHQAERVHIRANIDINFTQ